MLNKLRAAVLAVCAMAPISAHAGDFMLLGGQETCAEIAAEGGPDEAHQQWMFGYISGFNEAMSRDPASPLAWTGSTLKEPVGDTIKGWSLDYCTKHPTDHWINVAEMFYLAMIEQHR